MGALLTKLLDGLAKYNNTNPYVVVPIGAALAEIFASARGETSYMLGVGGTGTICVLLFMLLVVRLTGARQSGQAVMYPQYNAGV